MSAQAIKLLHVEDNVADRLLIARLLGAMKEYTFNIVRAATEITAVAELNKGGIEFVILDYKLPLGDGLGCLRKLRQIDGVVPIVVLSGVTTPEIGAECMQAGADDYLSKQDLSGEKLAASVRKAMNRASSWPSLQDKLVPLCQFFLTSLGSDFFKELDELEKALRHAEVTPDQPQILLESIAPDLEKVAPKLPYSAVQAARPVILELVQRLMAKPNPPKPATGSKPGVSPTSGSKPGVSPTSGSKAGLPKTEGT